jgi:predicted nucleotidyltransferase
MTDKVYGINEICGRIAPVAKSYGVRRLTLFGSYARGEATLGSDVDLRIADRGTLRGLFRLAAFERDLEKSLDLHVDVMPTDSLSDKFLENIREEEIVVYEA